MRISDWSSDVCSSDLENSPSGNRKIKRAGTCRSLWTKARREDFSNSKHFRRRTGVRVYGHPSRCVKEPAGKLYSRVDKGIKKQIGRASCRERVCQYV